MKKTLFFLFLPSLFFGLLPTIKVSYFKPTLPTSGEFFTIRSAEYQVEGIYQLYKGWNLFMSGALRTDYGSEHLRVFPVTGGVKYIQPVTGSVALYGYTGPRVFYQEKKDGYERTPFTGVVGSGFTTRLSKHFGLDTFGEWTKPINDVGGWNVGTGVSFIF